MTTFLQVICDQLEWMQKGIALSMKDKDTNKFYICILIKCTDNNKWKIRGTGTRKLLNIKKVW